MDSWYFAYGSNLWIDQMRARTGTISQAGQRPRIARLPDHRIVFQRLQPDGPAFANILAPGEGVQGVVYRCCAADLEKMDDYERGYERRHVAVTETNGVSLEAVAYVMKAVTAINFGEPSAEYLERIVTGARQHGLPEDYILSIVAIASLGGPRDGRCQEVDR